MPDGAAGDADQAFACRATLAAMTVPYWMALGTFAIGTEGFMIEPLLPKLVQDLSVSLVAAGQLVTVFTLSYAFSSPILTALTGGIGRRPLLILSIALGVSISAFIGQGLRMATHLRGGSGDFTPRNSRPPLRSQKRCRRRIARREPA